MHWQRIWRRFFQSKCLIPASVITTDVKADMGPFINLLASIPFIWIASKSKDPAPSATKLWGVGKSSMLQMSLQESSLRQVSLLWQFIQQRMAMSLVGTSFLAIPSQQFQDAQLVVVVLSSQRWHCAGCSSVTVRSLTLISPSAKAGYTELFVAYWLATTSVTASAKGSQWSMQPSETLVIVLAVWK